jgi:hypothetical protein
MVLRFRKKQYQKLPGKGLVVPTNLILAEKQAIEALIYNSQESSLEEEP